ncbi:TetR/AcrR family transcriptional regulator [Actinomyces oricola]|uniref:TetR/AcrR family transcriptional regulator n=1 Tax=Actinomyces oricola TaxID=206043 RepID=UPI000FFEFBCB|nr:TetR/AcrR family transcriptional regulator [Actinomyces oricola]
MPKRIDARGRTRSKDLPGTVIRATTEILEAEGLGAVTIRAVAAHAGVAPMSVYNHFGDKQGLLDAVAEHHFANLAQALGTITEPDPHQRLRQAGIIVHKLMTTHPRSYDLMWTTHPGPNTHNAFAQLVHLIQYGQAAGAFITANPTNLASAIWASIQGAISIEIRQNHETTDPTHRVSEIDYELLLDVILRGITRS